jgi:hypothetical protein
VLIVLHECDVAGLGLGEGASVRDEQVAVAEDFSPHTLGQLPDGDCHGGPLFRASRDTPIPWVTRRVAIAGKPGKSNRRVGMSAVVLGIDRMSGPCAVRCPTRPDFPKHFRGENMSTTDAESNKAAPTTMFEGEVVYLYAFDVANEIRLGQAAELLSGKPATFTLRKGRATPRSIPHSRPLHIEPPLPVGRLGGESVRLSVRIYEVGVVSLTIRVPFRCRSLSELASFHNPVLDDGRTLDDVADRTCDDVTRNLAACLTRPSEKTEPEAYTVFSLVKIGDEQDANRWMTDFARDIAGLLSETEPGRLSESQVAEVIRLRRSFEKSDLVVIDWDAALVVNLEGRGEELLFVLELANLQLEEFRWLDRSLDGYLDQAYVDLSRNRWSLFGFGRSTGVLRSLRQMRIDVAKLADEVTHITKFVGDWHLARVYLMARERFHLDQWRASVAQRLEELDQLYTLTRGDVYDRRMLWLEFIIVVFFAIDLVIIFFK